MRERRLAGGLVVVLAALTLAGCGVGEQAAVVATPTAARALVVVTPTMSAWSAAAASPVVTAATVVAQATIDPTSLETYVVQAGDTLFTIALLHGTDLETLQALNGIDDPASVTPGQEILVPTTP